MDELERVVVAAPCPISWEAMPGNDRVRYCSSCSKNVFNISDMSSKEAEQFLQENGTSQCVRLFRRQDGKVMTDNCPIVLRGIRNKCRLAMKMLAGLAASFMAFVPFGRGQECSAQQAVPYDGEPMISTDSSKKDTSKKPDAIKKPAENGVGKTPVPTIAPSAGLIALPEKSNNATTNGKQVMVGGDVCGVGTKNSQPGFSKRDAGNFVMGKMKAPVHVQENDAPKNEDGTFKRDSKAYDLYLKAKTNETAGNFIVAQTQYKEALALAKQQEKSDPKFIALVEKAFVEINKKVSGGN